ncbi:MAG: isochorismatase family protein [Methanomicrobiaceae archaeon]|nr:isochorismatase family protein [Methanomicrobiaceae archaeon]
MKEIYFKSQNLDEKKKLMLDFLKNSVNIRNFEFLPEDAALIIIDMQDYFLNENSHAFVPSTQAIIPGIKKLAYAFITAGRPVFCTRHINCDSDSGMMSEWYREVIREDNEKSQITSIFEIPDINVIKKTQYDAFYKTNLEEMLKEKKIKSVVITGVLTHLCCETTARSAFIRGFRVFFPVDGSATYYEKNHLASLLNLSGGFAVPVTIDGLIKEFEKNE